MASLDAPGIPWCPACPERARKHPILGILEARLALPFTQHLGQCGIKRHPCVGVFCFHVARYAGHDRSPHEQHALIPEHVTPPQREQLAAAETRGEIEDNHCVERVVEFLEQETELRDVEHNWLAPAFARAPDPHELHRVLADLDEFPTHRAVPEHAHEIVQVPLGSRSQIEVLQPLLHGEGLYLRNRILAPPRFDLVIEVRPVRVGGRVPQFGEPKD